MFFLKLQNNSKIIEKSKKVIFFYYLSFDLFVFKLKNIKDYKFVNIFEDFITNLH